MQFSIFFKWLLGSLKLKGVPVPAGLMDGTTWDRSEGVFSQAVAAYKISTW